MRSEISSLSVSITKLKIISEKWDGKKYYIKANIRINEDMTLALLKDSVKAKGNKKEIKKLNKLLGAKRFKISSLNKQLKKLNLKLENSIATMKILPGKTNAVNLFRTYGYLLGQEYGLNKISNIYPKLKKDVDNVKKEFNLVYGSSVKTITNIMLKNLALNDKEDFDKKIYDTLDFSIKTEQKAKDFISEVYQRCKGKIESPVIETLLIYNPFYNKHPEKELKDGFIQTYVNDGSGKAKGLEFSISVPLSWKSKAGERPNIVRKFVFRDGKSAIITTILVKKNPISNGKYLTQKDIQNVLNKNSLPKEAKLHDSGELTIENMSGYWQRYSLVLKRVRNEIYSETIIYHIFYKDIMLQIQSSVGTVNNMISKSKVLKMFKKYERTFDLIANSLILPSTYKDTNVNSNNLLYEAEQKYLNGYKKEAYKLFIKACEDNILAGCYNMALMNYNADGIKENKVKAKYVLENLCIINEYDSCFLMGDIYFKGTVGRIDKQKGLKLYKKACMGGVANACFNLAVAYYNGINNKKDFTKAKEYFHKACQGGNAEGCRGDKVLLKRGY